MRVVGGDASFRGRTATALGAALLAALLSLVLAAPASAASLWSDGTTPANAAATNDPDPIEVGVRFRPQVDGEITALRFYKGSTNTGRHVGHLWTSTGLLLAQATFTDETAEGWQEVALPTPVPVTAGATYVASYHAPQGNYAVNQFYFAGSAYSNPPLEAPRSGDGAGNGVYAYGPSGSFPTASYRASNYWVDVVFEPQTPAPVASYTYSPTSPHAGQEVTFDASGSSCSAPPCSYRWEDDGPNGPAVPQWPLGSGEVMRFTFTEPGTIHARLTVTDARGRSDSTVKTFTVSAPPPPPPPAQCADGIDNDGDAKVDHPADPGCADPTDDDETDPLFPPPTPTAPVASYTYSPTSPQAGQEVTFDASGSSCSVPPCSYRWEDDGPNGPAAPQWPLGSGEVMRFTFTEPGTVHARLTVTDAQGRSDSTVKTFTVSAPPPPPATCADGIDNDGDSKVDYPADPGCASASDGDETDPPPPPESPPESPPGLPPLGQPSCVDGATSVTSAAQLRTEVAAGRNACVTAAIGDADLSSLPSATMRHVGTSATGSIGDIRIDRSSQITFRARFRSTKITNSNNLTIEQSRVGGTSTNRTLEMLIFIAEPSDDITIRDNDIGWTTADNSGNTGFGIRAYNDSDNLRIERNYIHHIGADAIQLGLSGDNLVVDRNEVAYAARPPDSNEHSDDLQIVGHGQNARVTNNYFHHCGWFTASGPTTGCNALAIHAGTSNTLVYENNLQRDALGIPDLGDLGTGGCTRSNAVWRRNTWINNGTQFTAGIDVNYAHCGGSNNLWERNVVVETFGNKYGFAASGTTARDNVVGRHPIDPQTGACTSAACNPSGQEPIGFRKPSGVHW